MIRQADIGSARASVANWLLACGALVVAVLLIGGITRLTHSGLSIARWEPVAGILPPLGAAQWQEEFARYRDTPEFRERNPDMTLDGYKRIFWWEYLHRLLARSIGPAVVLPMIAFSRRGLLNPALRRRLVLLLCLGGLQGALGWFMVASGLVQEPRVSPLRLAAHFGLGMAIIAAVFLTAWQARGARTAAPPPAEAVVGTLLLFAMLIVGALAAGSHAGLVYNTFPLMGGGLVPPDVLLLRPWYDNLWRNPGTIQFLHRVLAGTLLLALPVLGCRLLRRKLIPPTALALPAAALAAQLGLGITTVLGAAAAPIAAGHQAGAVALWLSWLRLAYLASSRPADGAERPARDQ